MLDFSDGIPREDTEPPRPTSTRLPTPTTDTGGCINPLTAGAAYIRVVDRVSETQLQVGENSD